MLLVLNAGSSSLKAMIFDMDLQPLTRVMVTEIGGAAMMVTPSGKTAVQAPDHRAALDQMIRAAREAGFSWGDFRAAAHRVVHGGAAFTSAQRVGPDVLAGIAALCTLAPLHNPANLAGIAAVVELAPDLPQYVSFDTAFHATNPAVATRFALPQGVADDLRRYGFHGLSYAALAQNITPLPKRLLAFHLGNGASACAILDGRSVGTTMGYSPVDGLVMGTRGGAIDPMGVLELAQRFGIDGARAILNQQAGLKGLAGESDMARLLARDDDAARFAVEMFCTAAARQAAGLIPLMGGVDAMAFTGGIGENAAYVRNKILSLLEFLGELPIHVVAAEEERQIARDAKLLMEAGT